MKKSICYWCGAESTSSEHIPPRCFFPKGKREELFTVPSCSAHNEAFTKLDEKFRFILQASSDSPIAVEEFRNRTYPSLKRPEAKRFFHGLAQSSSPALLSGEKTLALSVSAKECDLFFEKILRALYFHHYTEVFHGEIRSACTHLSPPGFDIRPTIAQFVSFRPHLKYGNAKNIDVFRYECGRVTENDVTAFAMICTFYENITVFGLGTPYEK